MHLKQNLHEINCFYNYEIILLKLISQKVFQVQQNSVIANCASEEEIDDNFYKQIFRENSDETCF